MNSALWNRNDASREPGSSPACQGTGKAGQHPSTVCSCRYLCDFLALLALNLQQEDHVHLRVRNTFGRKEARHFLLQLSAHLMPREHCSFTWTAEYIILTEQGISERDICKGKAVTQRQLGIQGEVFVALIFWTKGWDSFITSSLSDFDVHCANVGWIISFDLSREIPHCAHNSLLYSSRLYPCSIRVLLPLHL